MTHAFLRPLFFSAATLAAAVSLPAAAVNWDITPGTVGAGDSAITGGVGAWNTTNGNWTTDTGVTNVAWVNANNDTAVFGGTGGTVTLGTAITAGGLTFNSGGYTVTGNTLTLAGTPSVTVTNLADTATIGSILAGSNGLTKSGDGTLTLTAKNSYTGGTTVNAGTLAFNSAVSGVGTVQGVVTVNAGATLRALASDSLGYSTGASVTTLNLNGGAFVAAVAGNQGYITNFVFTGGSSSGGTLNFTGSAAAGITSNASSTTSTISSAVALATNTVAVAQGTTASGIDLNITGVISGTTLTKTGLGTLSLGSGNTVTNIVVNAGTVRLAATNAAFGNLSVAAGATASTDAGFANSLTALTLTGGTLTGVGPGLAGYGSYTFRSGGSITQSGSVASVINSQYISLQGSGTQLGFAVAATGTGTDLTVSSSIATATGSSNVGINKTGTGKLILSGANTYSGATTVTAGTLTAGNANAFGTGAVTVNGGTLDLGAFNVANTVITLNGGALTASTYSKTVNLTGAATISGTFSGTVNTGTSASRVITTTGGLSVGTLAGQGVFTGGLVTVTGTHNPGNSPGTQTFNNGLSYANGVTLNLEIAADGSIADSIVVAGGLSVGTGVNLNLALFGTADYSTGFWDSNHSFSLLSITGGTTGSFILGSTGGLGGAGEGTWLLSQDAGGVTAAWTATAVPEPSTYGLIGAGALAAAAFVRRRRNTAV